MAGYCWQHWSVGESTPPGAVLGGRDADGAPIYVGRGYHQGDVIPAKVIPDKNAAYIPYNGDEVFLNNCEILCQQRFTWMPAFEGIVPNGAIPVGHTADGEQLFVGRVFHEGSNTIGKVHPSHNVCYIPFNGREISYTNYEVLVLTNN